MSQYYAGYDVLGCVLIDDEIEYFKQRYIEHNLDYLKKEVSEDIGEIEVAVDEWVACNEPLAKNQETGEGEISPIYITIDQCDGMLLYPASNYNKKIRYNATSYRHNVCLVIEARHQPGTIQQLAHDKFYESYDELKNEFIEKIGWAVPYDFPFDERIGDFQYACYA